MSTPRWTPSPGKRGTYWLILFDNGRWSVGIIDEYAEWTDPNTLVEHVNAIQIRYTIVGGWIPTSGPMRAKTISTQYISQLPNEMQYEIMDSIRYQRK